MKTLGSPLPSSSFPGTLGQKGGGGTGGRVPEAAVSCSLEGEEASKEEDMEKTSGRGELAESTASRRAIGDRGRLRKRQRLWRCLPKLIPP